ncbi:MAG: hypothetical protein Q4F66_00710 [Clostridium sp.]|nr:hypothetical protein [Clostridium sp.]
MNVKELTLKTINDIEKRRLKKEKEYSAYTNERYFKKIRTWSVRVGGCRW